MVGCCVRRSPPAASDVHDDHARGEGNAEAQQHRTCQRQFKKESGRSPEKRRQDRLERRRPQESPALRSQLGDAGFPLKSELVPGSQTAGIVSMVNSSQFFINLEDNSSAIPGNTYNIFGTVTSGLDVAKQIEPGDKINAILITSVPVSQPQQTTHATINIATGVVVNGKTTTILVDSKGRTLYYFTDDSATKATCVGTCAQTWIALRYSSASRSSTLTTWAIFRPSGEIWASPTSLSRNKSSI